MTKQRLILLCTADIALHYGVAAGTIRRWASEDHWHAYGTRRRRTWNLHDAQKSWDHRHKPEAI